MLSLLAALEEGAARAEGDDPHADRGRDALSAVDDERGATTRLNRNRNQRTGFDDRSAFMRMFPSSGAWDGLFSEVNGVFPVEINSAVA